MSCRLFLISPPVPAVFTPLSPQLSLRELLSKPGGMWTRVASKEKGGDNAKIHLKGVYVPGPREVHLSDAEAGRAAADSALNFARMSGRAAAPLPSLRSAGELRVLVLAAEGLPELEGGLLNGKVDPYLRVRWEWPGEQLAEKEGWRRTAVAPPPAAGVEHSSPTWNETVSLSVDDARAAYMAKVPPLPEPPCSLYKVVFLSSCAVAHAHPTACRTAGAGGGAGGKPSNIGVCQAWRGGALARGGF